jgi:hypothetical protein
MATCEKPSLPQPMNATARLEQIGIFAQLAGTVGSAYHLNEALVLRISIGMGHGVHSYLGLHAQMVNLTVQQDKLLQHNEAVVGFASLAFLASILVFLFHISRDDSLIG